MSADPTNAELLAGAIALAGACQQIIKGTDRNSSSDTVKTLDIVSDAFVAAGVNMAILADRLGIKAEVERLSHEQVKGTLTRTVIMRSFADKAGRA